MIINIIYDVGHRYFYCWLLGISISIPLNSRHSLIGNPYILRVYNYHRVIISERLIWLRKRKTIISDNKFNFPYTSATVSVFHQYNKYQFSYNLTFLKRIGSEKSNQDDVTFSLFIFMLIDWISKHKKALKQHEKNDWFEIINFVLKILEDTLNGGEYLIPI